MDLYRFGIDLRDNIPIDPVGMKVSLVLSHLPALGRVSKPICQKFNFKKGEFIDLRSHYGRFTVIFWHFHGRSIAAKYDLYLSLFLQSFAKHGGIVHCWTNQTFLKEMSSEGNFLSHSKSSFHHFPKEISLKLQIFFFIMEQSRSCESGWRH